MAKRGGGSRGKARGRGKQPTRRRRAGAASGRHAAGARRTRTAAAAHEVRSAPQASAGVAPPPANESREAAELARDIEAVAGSAMDDLRRRTEAASRELGHRREEMEAEARRREAERELPGAASMGLELAAGALRLVGAMVTAPFRIGLALLRPREA